VFHGDTLRAQSTVTDRRETSDGERGVVTMRVEAYVVDGGRAADGAGDADADADGEGDADRLVCEFDRTVLSERRPGAARGE
jgi:acyl dehydratase